jgi:hypothetical protein
MLLAALLGDNNHLSCHCCNSNGTAALFMLLLLLLLALLLLLLFIHSWHLLSSLADSHFKKAALLQVAGNGNQAAPHRVAAHQKVGPQESQVVPGVGEADAVVEPGTVVVKADDAAAADDSKAAGTRAGQGQAS